MKILIVEDDEIKRSQLNNFISDTYPSCKVWIAKSYHSGLKAIIEKSSELNLIILDMTMPTFDIGGDEDGGRPQAYAGREILNQLDRRGIFIPVVVVTQYEVFGEGTDALTLQQLDELLMRVHQKSYLGTVYYNAAVEGWKQSLNKIISKIIG